jgi:outer membrane protein OmpA-like peptidoglycan-associated protein
VRLNNVFFDFNKSDLKEESFPELDRVAQFMEENPNVTIEIAGHTDNVGSDEYNLKLSGGRVGSVESYLVGQRKVAANRVVTKSYGKAVPVATNDTEEGRAQNRRVEFKILKN